MSNDPIFFAPLKVPVTDPQTGLMTRDWYLFFQAMFLRIGGAQAFTPDDLQIMGDVNDATDDGNDIRASTADLERTASLDEPQSPTDLSELQALTASFAEDPIIARFTAQSDGLTPASGGGALKFLRADGWAVAAANPSAAVGPAVVNGVANTFLRSDAAPPIDLTAAYAWTGTITYVYNNAGTQRITATNSNAGAAALMLSELVNNGGNALQMFARSSAAATANEGVIQMNGGPLTLGTVGGFVTTLSGDTKTVGKSGFNNTAPIVKPTVTGSRAANAALASVLTALASYGLITDSSTI